MFYQTEEKLQGWRAVAVFEDRSECLIFIGRSTTQVRAGYPAAYIEVLTEEERAQVQTISLQCWQGAPDKGHWIQKGTLTVPSRKPEPVVKILARRKPLDLDILLDEEDEEAKSNLLPFRKLGAVVDDVEVTPSEEAVTKRVTATA
jgi:hypothetical protein